MLLVCRRKRRPLRRWKNLLLAPKIQRRTKRAKVLKPAYWMYLMTMAKTISSLSRRAKQLAAKGKLKVSLVLSPSVSSELSEDDSAYKPTKKSSTKKVLEDDVACKPSKKSTKESAAPVEKGKCKSLEEHNLVKEDTLSSGSTSKAVVASSRGIKRASVSIAQELDPQLPRKRFKSGTTNVDSSLHKNSNLSGEAPLVTSKKRRRNPKDAESEVEDGMDKCTKRKKHSSPSESRQSPEISVEEDSVKPVAKRSRKVATTRKGKKQSSDNSTTTSYVKRLRHYIKILNIFSRKRKENAPMSKPSMKVRWLLDKFPPSFYLWLLLGRI